MLERLAEIESPLIRKIIGYPLLALMWIVFGLLIAIIAAVTFYAIQALMPFIASFVSG